MNKRVILGALMIICSAGILTPVGIIIIFWEYFKKAIKIDFYTVYLVFRLIIWFFIQLPLGILKVSTEGISSALHKAISLLTEKPKLNGFLFLLSLIFFSFLFPDLLISSSEITDIGAIFDSLWSFIMVIGFAILTTILLDVIYVTFSSGEIAKIDPRDTTAAGHYSGMKEGFQESAQGVKAGKKVYQDIEPEKATEEVKDVLRFWEQDDIQAIIRQLEGLIPGLGGGKAAKEGAETAAKRAGASAAETAGMGTLGAVFIVAIIFIVVQWLILIGVLGFYLQAIIPVVAGPVSGALGLGSDYGNYLGGEVADRYLAGVQVNMDEYVAPALEARQRVYCLLQGPACLRAWRLNNTRTPGSDAVGEQYLLDIERFEVGSGEQLDIAYKNKDYTVPISFGLSNSRNGLKGINAYNVSYRIRAIDFDRGRDDPYCDTGWTPVEGFEIRRGSGKWYGNDLHPGTAAQTGFLTLEEFNLENCGMMQPGAGTSRTIILDVQYDYFSQATLYFDAMAQETLISNPDIEKSWKQSETADTPVKSALNVNSPVLYNQDDLDAQPFSMRASLYTEERNVEYQVKSLEVEKSSQVETANVGSQNCRLEEGEGENILVPSDTTNVIKDSDSDSAARWFDSDNNPPFFGCTMQLANPSEISPEGETLTMGVRSNYTVKLAEPLETFRILNTRCGEAGINCPLLVTHQFAEEQETPENWKYKCQGPDVARTGQYAGCDVVNGDEDWSTLNSDMFMVGDDPEQNYLESRLERGEIAIDPVAYEETSQGESYNFDYSEGEVAIGLTESEIESLENSFGSVYSGSVEGQGYTFVSYLKDGQERETEIRELEYILCREDSSKADYAEYVMNQYPTYGQNDEPTQEEKKKARNRAQIQGLSYSEALEQVTSGNTYNGKDATVRLFGFQPAVDSCTDQGFLEGYLEEQDVTSLILGPSLIANQIRGLKSGYENIAQQYSYMTCEADGDKPTFKVYDPDEGPKCINGEAKYEAPDEDTDDSG